MRWLFDSSRTAVSHETRRGDHRIIRIRSARTSRDLYYLKVNLAREQLLLMLLVKSSFYHNAYCVKLLLWDFDVYDPLSMESIGHVPFAHFIDVHRARNYCQVRAHFRFIELTVPNIFLIITYYFGHF